MIAGTNFSLVDFGSVRPAVERLAGRWIAPNVIDSAGRASRATLANEDGVVVVELCGDPRGMQAFVLIAASYAGSGAFRRNEAAIVEIARDMGASTLAFRSDRRGWRRALGPQWRRRGDLYERTV